jgi:hypothetical protein
VRSHPFVGSFFLLLGAGLVVLGALAGSFVPPALRHLPLPPEVVVPLVLWQLATWAILFGFFFLRPRARGGRPSGRPVARI